ncbi:hypothetical protein LEP1GSC115_3730 [Leptospira interrogans serovar Australis str. 200703203]|nr:hypothetical protein LEP1GSC115_3730 [Leptospira interrogans serovar Australis str. 200703203]
MKAFLIFHPPKYGGKILNSEQIQESIRERGIKFGIRNEVLNLLSEEPEYGKKF